MGYFLLSFSFFLLLLLLIITLNNMNITTKKYKKIKKKVKSMIANDARKLFATNYIGYIIIASMIVFMICSGFISIFIEDSQLHFIREILRSFECILISTLSYFFGNINKDK